MKRNKIKVGLVIGGASGEREVSKLSGRGVLAALKNLGYKITLIDPAYGANQPDNEDLFFSENDYRTPSHENYLTAINSEYFNGLNCVFNGLHGSWGEDGTIQSLFEFRNLKYTGSGVLPSSISMNKTFTKVMFKHYGVNTPEWILVNKSDVKTNDIINRVSNLLNFPCVVKPNNQGSALGLTICHSEDELIPAIKLAQIYSDEALIEEYIEGYELTVGIINDQVLPPLEIKPKHEFYDYTCKYTSGMSEYEVPAKFPTGVLNELKSQALLAYNSINCKSYGRIDFRLSKDYKPYCLEVNTLPGLTSTSLLPKAAKAVNISFEELIDRIVLNSLESD